MAHNYRCVTALFLIPKQEPKQAQTRLMVAFDLDKIFQYSDGRDLLSATLAEHERLLWELENLAKEPQRDGDSDITNRLNLIKAQVLLFERLMIGEKIDSLVVLVNHYAEILSKPRMEIRKAIPQ